MTLKTLRAGALALGCALLLLATSVASQADDPPQGVKQLLPRGGIPAIFNPHFVTASSADIPDDAWVLGVVIDGQAKVYDLNILNHHEIVNDVVGGKPVAPTW